MKKNWYLILFLALVIGCTSSRKVARVDADQTIDLSGRWNDTDSRLVAEEMTSDALNRPWLNDFENNKSRKPVLIVGVIKNKTSEHINTETFSKDIEREFINSGKIKIVQNAQGREEIREERAAQQDFSLPETVKQWGKEKGADLILQGVINSITDQNNKEKVVYYQVSLEMTDLESNEKVWIGDKKIKKVVK